jgi:sulfhydrogenase subunit beta (sulfur reductase)
MKYFIIGKKNWDKILEQLTGRILIYASVEDEFGQDYEVLTREMIPTMVYNKPKPITPLKNFFLPIKENVSHLTDPEKQRVIIGIPNCDLEGLSILDEIYLDAAFHDPFYKQKRGNTILITSDCFGISEHCHCTTYGIKPFADGNGDLSLALLDEQVVLKAFTEKGQAFIADIGSSGEWVPSSPIDNLLDKKHAATIQKLDNVNHQLPGYPQTGGLIKKSTSDIWKKYASQCVSCGACSAICPTCSCFLLIDKPDFEKVKQLDVCQYPGFERVAGGEDALHERYVRFRNRYLCKYVWKPEKFQSLACTGCGRCIETCIGQINKNELFRELANQN